LILPSKFYYLTDSKSVPNWEAELQEDVDAECEKFGKITHIAIDPNSKGFIYIKFSSRHAADDAIKALDGRFFGGKQVTAVHISEEDYVRMFPKAAVARK
jgi:RNA-binding protein 23/39